MLKALKRIFISIYTNRKLHKVAKDINSSPDEKLIASILDGLFYYVVKEECAKRIIDDKTPKKEQDILKDKNFTISLGLKQFKCTGKLILPAQQDWKQLLNYLNWSTVGNDKLLAEKLSAINRKIREFFIDGHPENHCQHKKVRKVFSLPVIPTLSGASFRIHRKSQFAPSPWQMLTATSVFKGFAISDNLNQPLTDDVYADGKNVHEINQHVSSLGNELCLMDEWLEIDVPIELQDKVQVLLLKPGSKNRRYIRLTMKFEHFKNLVLPHMKNSGDINNGLQILPQMKIDKPTDFKTAFLNKLGKPRTFINFNKIGNVVTFEYENDGCPAELSKNYIQKWKEKHNRT